jgi:hypothetical protein
MRHCAVALGTAHFYDGKVYKFVILINVQKKVPVCIPEIGVGLEGLVFNILIIGGESTAIAVFLCP